MMAAHAKLPEIRISEPMAMARTLPRSPPNLRVRGSAAEAMLSARQGPRALHFAEQGLETARQQNNRDSEQLFLELVEAAKRQKD